MPMKEGYHNPVMPLDRPAAKKAPHAYATTQQPAKSKSGAGRSVSPGFTSGGGMQGGGKRRPGSRTVR